MFTVRVQKAGGLETLYECEELTKEPNAIVMQGVFFGQHHHTEVIGPRGQLMSVDWDRKVEQRLDDDDTKATIFVMNSHGKTVANYTM